LQIVAKVRRMFDLGADPEAVHFHLGQDQGLLPLVQARPGLRVPGAWDSFEVAIRAILGQQISVAAARTLVGRLVEAYGEPLSDLESSSLRRVFPRPEVLAEAGLEEIGLPLKRRETIRGLARALLENRIDLDNPPGLDDFIAGLTGLPGIGAWTAQYIALRLSEPDAFPAGDLGLRKAATAPGEELISEKNLLRIAERWRPWRAYAAMYLWERFSLVDHGAG
jgi:AraC family transcriptional regulator of adaptative response / DNA-3-methyladenine glycosylase II